MPGNPKTVHASDSFTPAALKIVQILLCPLPCQSNLRLVCFAAAQTHDPALRRPYTRIEGFPQIVPRDIRVASALLLRIAAPLHLKPLKRPRR